METKVLVDGFGARLRKLRKEHGLSQEGLATLARVTQQTVHQYEKGATLPSVEFIYLLRDHQFDLQYLLFGTEPSANGKDCPDWVVKYIAQTVANINQQFAAGGLSDEGKVRMTDILLRRYREAPDAFEMNGAVLIETLLKGA